MKIFILFLRKKSSFLYIFGDAYVSLVTRLATTWWNLNIYKTTCFVRGYFVHLFLCWVSCEHQTQWRNTNSCRLREIPDSSILVKTQFYLDFSVSAILLLYELWVSSIIEKQQIFFQTIFSMTIFCITKIFSKSHDTRMLLGGSIEVFIPDGCYPEHLHLIKFVIKFAKRVFF